MTREESAFNRIFRGKPAKTPTDTIQPWPQRTMRVTGPNLDARCIWQQKYGVWFCIQADRPIYWMANPHSWTEARLPSLTRQGLSFAWA